MLENKFILLVLFFGISVYSCSDSPTRADSGDKTYIAFSLKEAQMLLKQHDDSLSDSTVYNLAGITRIVGMVIDKRDSDIILVGQRNSELPAARFDDFVTALRARFVYNELPMVSIDPTPNTAATGQQAIRFGGHIEQTSFGQDFLESDILLKKYSLEQTEQVQSVPSYKILFANNEINSLVAEGIKVKSVEWISPDSLGKFKNENLLSGENTQTRFWYNYKDPYTVRIRGNVFCIMALDITVEDEINSDGVLPKSDSPAFEKRSPGALFSSSFAANFYKVSDAHPVIKRLKLLFDMTAIAEGLRNTKDIPDISFLLKSYPVKKVNTAKEFGLIKLCAVVSCSDGRTNLIQLSGGVSPSVDLQWLNAGDVGYLEKFVLQSRPDENSLFWTIPIDKWDMPNANGIAMNKKNGEQDDDNGCTVNSYQATLGNNIPTVNYRPYSGTFREAAHTFDPIPTKGVQMRMKIDTASFKRVDSLKNIRESILKKH